MHTPVMESEPPTTRNVVARRADIALVLLVAAAVVLAIAGVAENAGRLPPGAFASVNGQSLPLSQLDSVLARLGDQLGHEPGSAERAEVVARLVDEELLLQQGLVLDMVRADTRLRSQLVQGVISQAISEASAAPVDDDELRRFLASNEGYFRRPDGLRIERYRFSDPAVAARALAGDANALALGERDTTLPSGMLTGSRWRDYLGSTLADRVVSLPVGAVAAEVDTARSSGVLRLVERIAGGVPPLEVIRPQVEAEFRRRRDEEALRRYVERLRSGARIITADAESGR